MSWFIEVVESTGDTYRFDPGVHDPAQRQWRHQVQTTSQDSERQLALCERWLTEAAAVDPSVRSLSVRRAVIEIPRQAGQPDVIRSDREVVGCRR